MKICNQLSINCGEVLLKAKLTKEKIRTNDLYQFCELIEQNKQFAY